MFDLNTCLNVFCSLYAFFLVWIYFILNWQFRYGPRLSCYDLGLMNCWTKVTLKSWNIMWLSCSDPWSAPFFLSSLHKDLKKHSLRSPPGELCSDQSHRQFHSSATVWKLCQCNLWIPLGHLILTFAPSLSWWYSGVFFCNPKLLIG